jgi:hypothetical protein
MRKPLLFTAGGIVVYKLPTRISPRLTRDDLKTIERGHLLYHYLFFTAPWGISIAEIKAVLLGIFKIPNSSTPQDSTLILTNPP